MNIEHSNINLEKIDKWLEIYQTEGFKPIVAQQSQQQKYLIIAQIFSIQRLVVGLDTYIPTVNDVEEKEELMVLSQQIKVPFCREGIHIIHILESYYQNLLLVLINNQIMPLQVKGTFTISEKTWLVEFDELQPDFSVESHAIVQLNNVLKQWQQQANKTAQDQLAIQQLGSGQSLKQYVWERNPLLSQEFEDNAEYFSSYCLDLPGTYKNNKSTEIVEWLLFANIAHNSGNHQWLMWREQMRKFVELMGDNYTLTQISTLIDLLSGINRAKLFGNTNSELENQLKNMLALVKHSDPGFNYNNLPQWGEQLIDDPVIFKQEEELSKSLLLLRAKLLAAPYQYGHIGGRLHIWEGQSSHLYYDRQ